MTQIKSFYAWITSTHKNSAGTIGELARTIKAYGRDFTRGWGYQRNRASLRAVGASHETLMAFETAWKEYEGYKAGATR